jgi:hypothetical protein
MVEHGFRNEQQLVTAVEVAHKESHLIEEYTNHPRLFPSTAVYSTASQGLVDEGSGHTNTGRETGLP